MPPGTSDIALTVYQSLPLDGVVLVTTPQDLVSMIVGKAVNMATSMNVKIFGLVENMAYIKCPHCDEKIYPYGESKLAEVCNEYHIMPLASMPIDPSIAQAVDNGDIESITVEDIENIINEIEEN